MQSVIMGWRVKDRVIIDSLDDLVGLGLDKEELAGLDVFKPML